MANIDYFGNTIRVTGAGTVGHEFIEIESMVIWSLNTSANLVVIEADSGGSEVFNFSTNVATPYTTHFSGLGRYHSLSFNTVTACTAYLNIR